LLSVAIQGSFLPYLAQKTNMIDKFCDVRKTFNDYQQESAIALNKMVITETHPWNGLAIKNIQFNGKALILMITRKNRKIVPKGATVLKENDEVLIGTTYQNSEEKINLCETYIDKKHEWLDKKIKEINLTYNHLIALIKRGEEFFVPNGNTQIKNKDTIIFYNLPID
jgi:cell volume regulation protein A